MTGHTETELLVLILIQLILIRLILMPRRERQPRRSKHVVHGDYYYCNHRRTQTHACSHARRNTGTYARTTKGTHACKRRNTHTHAGNRKCTQARLKYRHTRTHTHACSYTGIPPPAQIHAVTHAYKSTHAHPQTHGKTYKQSVFLNPYCKAIPSQLFAPARLCACIPAFLYASCWGSRKSAGKQQLETCSPRHSS